MKNLIHSAYSIVGGVSLVLAAGATTVSCSDFLEVPLESTVATSNFYKTAEEFDLGLTGVYNMLLSAEWANGDRYGSYFQGFLILGRVGTDEMIIPNNIDGNETELCNYTYTPSHRYISRTWYVQYRGIQRACVIIDRLTNTDIGNESEKNRILGEAYFLRALSYYMLVNLYGLPYNEATAGEAMGVPINLAPTIQDEQFRRSSVADVYSQIESDLNASIQHFKQAGLEKSIFRPNLATSYLLASRVSLIKKQWDRTIRYADSVEMSTTARLMDMKSENTGEKTFLSRVNPELLFSYGGYDLASVQSAARSHIYDIICISYYIQVMFDDNNSGALADQCLENIQQSLHIQRVETDGRFIEDEH